MELNQLINISRVKPQKSAESFEVYYRDRFPIEIYKKRHPNLDPKEYEYIQTNWINPVKKLVGDAIFESQKIFTDGNYSIQTKNETINKFIETYEIMSFFKNIYWQNILLDSDSVLTYHIKYSEFIEKQEGIERGNEYLPLHPYLVTSENILYKDKTSLIYRVKGDKKVNFVALYYNEENYLTYEHYSYNTADKKTEPILYWQFDNKTGKRYHRQADGIKIVNDNELVIKSYFSPSESILSTIIIDSVNLGVTKTRTTYPKDVVVGEPCNGEGCNGGYVDSIKDGERCSEICQKCEGSGMDKLHTPFSTLYVTRGNSAIGNETPPAPHYYWVDPPQGAVESTRADIRENRNIAFDYIGLKYSDTEVKGTETALGKMIDREKVYSTYKMYSQDIEMTIQWFLDGWSELMFSLEKDNKINAVAYNNFRTLSTAEVSEIFTQLQKDNAPQYILIDLLKKYYTSIGEVEKFEIVNKYYLYKSDEMNIKKGSLGYYDKTQIVISDNIMKWVDDEGVMDMNEAQMDKYFKDKASELMNIPILDEGNIMDMPSANKLRETVGGLQGIIEIAKAVASGLYDLDAGISLISSLYGITREEATQWLGTPTIANKEVLDQVETIVT